MIRKGGEEPHRLMEAKRDRPAAVIWGLWVATKHAPWAAAICHLQASQPNQPEDIPRLRVAAIHRHHQEDTRHPRRKAATLRHRSRVGTLHLRAAVDMAHPLPHRRAAATERLQAAMAHLPRHHLQVAQPGLGSPWAVWAR
jgi:hypothetical protein